MLTYILGAALLALAAGSKCPPNWTSYEQSCYTVVKEERNYHEAQAYCAALNGYLPEIFTQGENDFLQTLGHATGIDYIWIGGDDILVEGQFTFPRSKAAVDTLEYTRWKANQPDDSNGEDCMHIISSTGEWNDFPCDTKRAFYCQMPYYTTC